MSVAGSFMSWGTDLRALDFISLRGRDRITSGVAILSLANRLNHPESLALWVPCVIRTQTVNAEEAR